MKKILFRMLENWPHVLIGTVCSLFILLCMLTAVKYMIIINKQAERSHETHTR